MSVNSPSAIWVDMSRLHPESREILALDPHDASLAGDVSARMKSLATVRTPFPANP
jgi:hypothetical protein